MVLVYNQHGQFVRYIGMFHGENMYERPTGIAIDRKAGRLYLADTPRNLVFILDLQGNVLKRVGKDKNGNGSGEFVSPTQIAVSDHGIVVLDTGPSRIQILDFDGNRTGCYRVAVGVDRDNGLAVDQGRKHLHQLCCQVHHQHVQTGWNADGYVWTIRQQNWRVSCPERVVGRWQQPHLRRRYGERAGASLPSQHRANFPTLARSPRHECRQVKSPARNRPGHALAKRSQATVRQVLSRASQN